MAIRRQRFSKALVSSRPHYTNKPVFSLSWRPFSKSSVFLVVHITPPRQRCNVPFWTEGLIVKFIRISVLTGPE